MEQLINFIIRPPRAEYNPKNDLLDQEFQLKRKWYQRKDLEVVNSRGDVLQCSHYIPIINPGENTLPCVIYCHGNSGCRTDASEAAVILLPLNITVFTLDFSGSGLSGGEHVTLGWNEKDDLRAVVDYLRADGNVSLIGLWGRSMGAVTSLMYGAEDPSIAGMVLDSPFSDLVDLMMELVDTYKVRLPKFTVKFAIQYMRRAIQKKAKFDISDLNAIKVAKSCYVPVLFGHAIDDDFIQPHHSDRIFDAYVGDKNIIKFEGDHNSPRPQFYFDSISIFFKNVLQPPEEEVGGAYFDLADDYLGRGRWSTFHDVDPLDDLLDSHTVPAANSTEDAIKQLRSKRPMSSTVVPSDISDDKQPIVQVGSRGSDSHPSSSNMINFEFSKGNNPEAIYDDVDDDEYVEYPLNSLADFPSNAEEEERMFMEAVLESLKDLEVRPQSADEAALRNGIDSTKLETQPKNEEDDSSTQNNHLNTDLVAPSTTNNSLLEPNNNAVSADPTVKSAPLDSKMGKTCSTHEAATSNLGLPDASLKNHSENSSNEVKDKPNDATHYPHPIDKETSVVATSDNDMPSSSQRSSDADMADRTTVTVKVVKNPSNNIMDGLLRRWDLNFFKSR